MNFEQMEHIVTVANEESITKASEKLFISTSGLSQSISQLENELGIKIFNRSKRSIIPTIEGKIVISTAKSIIKAINEMNIEINRNKNEKYLKIVSLPGLNHYLLDTALKYKLKNKDFNFVLKEWELEKWDLEQRLEAIMKEEYDFAIIPVPLKGLKKLKNMSYKKICNSHFCIGAGRSSPFYSLEYVTLNDLKEAKIINYEPVNFNLLSKMFNVSPNQIILNANHNNSLLYSAKRTDAIFIAPKIGCLYYDLVKNGDIKMIPIKENNRFFEIDYWIIYLESKGLTNLASEFIGNFVECVDEFSK